MLQIRVTTKMQTSALVVGIFEVELLHLFLITLSVAKVLWILMIMMHSWNDYDWRKPKYSARNLSQCYIAHHIMSSCTRCCSCTFLRIYDHPGTRCYSVDIVAVDLFI